MSPSIGSGLFSVGLASAGGVGTRVGAAFVEVFADTAGLRSGFASAERDLKTFEGRLAFAGNTMSVAGGKMTRYLTVPLIAAGGVASKFAADFDRAMMRTSALAGIPQQKLESFRKTILALSEETAQAPEALADSLYLVGSAGLRAAEILPVLQMSARGAAAEMGDAATLGHLLSGVLVAFGDEAPTAAQAMDVITAAIREGKAEPADLAANLGTVVPVAAEMGVSFDQLAGSIAAATNVNIEAARAATGLRYMLIQLQNPTETAKKTLASYHMTIAQIQQDIRTKGLIPALVEMTNKFDLSTAAGKEAFFTVVGGVRSGQVALALLGKSLGRTEKALRATKTAAGDTGNEFQDAYRKMTNTDAFKMQKDWNDLRLAAIAAGEELLPVAMKIVNAVGTLAKNFAQLPEPVQHGIVMFGLWVAAAGPVLRLMGGMATNLSRIIGLFKGASAAAEASSAVIGSRQLVAGLSLPVVGASEAVGGGALSAGLGASAAALGEWAVVAGVATWAGLRLFNTLKDDTVSSQDLADQTGLSTAQVEALNTQIARGATLLNPMTSATDKVSEAGKIYAQVLREAKTAGMDMGRAQEILNAHFADAVEKIGGVTGSMPAFRQQLESSLGLAQSPEAKDFLDFLDHWSSWTAPKGWTAPGVPTAPSGPGVPSVPHVQVPTGLAGQLATSQLGTPLTVDDWRAGTVSEDEVLQSQMAVDHLTESYRELIDRINGALKGGADMKSIVRGLTSEMQRGTLPVEQYNALLGALGQDLPFQQLGEFGRVIRETGNASDEQRTKLAGLLAVSKQYGLKLSDLGVQYAYVSAQNGDFTTAIKTLESEIRERLNKSLVKYKKNLDDQELASIQAALQAGNLRRAVKLLAQAIKDVPKKHETEFKSKGKEKLKGDIREFQDDQKQGRILTWLIKANRGRQWNQSIRGAKGDITSLQALTQGLDDKTIKKKEFEVSANTTQAWNELSAIEQAHIADKNFTIWAHYREVKHEGGIVAHSGRYIPGSGEVDVRALAGEFISNRRSTSRYLDVYRALNAEDTSGAMRALAGRVPGRRAGGGVVREGGQVVVNLRVDGYARNPRELAAEIGREVGRRVVVEGGYRV